MHDEGREDRVYLADDQRMAWNECLLACLTMCDVRSEQFQDSKRHRQQRESVVPAEPTTVGPCTPELAAQSANLVKTFSTLICLASSDSHAFSSFSDRRGTCFQFSNCQRYGAINIQQRLPLHKTELSPKLKDDVGHALHNPWRLEARTFLPSNPQNLLFLPRFVR